MSQPHQPVIHGTKPCPKCKQPMEWHSVETVQASMAPYIDGQPERMHENFNSLAVEALREAWPCRNLAWRDW